MADNLDTTATVSTVPVGTKIATREVTYSGDAAASIAPVGLVTFAGSDDAKTVADVPGGGGVEASALRVTIASDSTGVLSVDDNGGSLTVDVGTALPAGTNNIGDVDVLTVPAPLNVVGTGTEAAALRVTIATDSTGVLSVDDNGNSLTVDGTVAVSGTVAVTQSGTWDEVGINDSGNSITVDSPQLPAALAANGGIKVEGVAGGVTIPVTEASAANALTSLQLIDDIVYTDDTSTHSTGSSKGALFMAAAAPTDSAVNANDIGAVAMTTDRKLHVSVQDALPAGNNNVGDVDVASIAAGDNNIGNVDIVTVPTDPFGANADAASSTGSISAKLRSISGVQLPAALGSQGALKVEGVASGTAIPISVASIPSHAVTNAGTFLVQENGAAATSLALIDDPVFADGAAFTVATSKVMMAGAAVVAHGAPDAADAGDAGALLVNRHRVLWTIGGNPNAKSATYNATGSGTDDNILPAISAGTVYVITGLTITLDAAATVNVAVRIGFGTSTVPALGAAAADAVDDILFYHPGIVPGTTVSIGNGAGILGVGGDGAELRITNGAPTTGTLGITVRYYTIAS